MGEEGVGANVYIVGKLKNLKIDSWIVLNIKYIAKKHLKSISYNKYILI